MKEFIPFKNKIWLATPTMHNGDEMKYVKEAYETNWMSTVGENIDEVEKRYFASYQDIPPSCVSLINICISRDVRGQGIGGKMMDAFFQVKQGPFELFVLADNPAAVKLYQAKGFQITQQQGGFSLDGIAPLCYRMVKE